MATIIDLDLTNSHNDTGNPCSCGSCSSSDIANGFVEPRIIMHLPDNLLTSSITLSFTKPDSTTLETTERIIDTETKSCSYSMPLELFSAVGLVPMTITAKVNNEVVYQSSIIKFNVTEALTSNDCAYISLVDYSVTPHIFNVSKCINENTIVSDINNLFKDVSFNATTGVLTFTRYDGTTKTIDTPMEEIVSDGYYDGDTQKLVLVLVSGQTIQIPVSGLIDDYSGSTSSTIQVTISNDNVITANLVGGGITKNLLSTTLQNEIDNKVDKVDGKGLSTNDFTTAEKNKLVGIETGAQVNPTIDTSLSATSENAVQNKVVTNEFNNYATKTSQIISGYGTCSTAAATAAKVVTISDTNWSLKTGTIIGVKFTNTNTASNCTLNVNNTGAKSIYYNNAVYTGNNTNVCGYANRLIYYIYDGTYWVWISNSSNLNTNDIPSAICWTASATAAKTATCHSYSLLSKSYIQVIVQQSNTYAGAITLNINGKGAKPIYINGSASSSSNYTLPAGSYFVYYNGTNYFFRTDGKITGDITGSANSATYSTTQATGDASTKIATTAFVNNSITAAGSIVKISSDVNIWELDDGIYYIEKNVKAYYKSSSSIYDPWGIAILKVNRITDSDVTKINFIFTWGGNTNGETSFYGTADETSGNIVFYNGITSDGMEAPTPSQTDTNTNRVTTIGWVNNKLTENLLVPNGNYETLTIGASATTYTAPANGWFVARGETTDGNSYKSLSLINQTNNFIVREDGWGGNAMITANIPVKKGDVVRFEYTGVKSWTASSYYYFRFYYGGGVSE